MTTVKQLKDAEFYLQDTRSIVGNSMLWWAKDGARIRVRHSQSTRIYQVGSNGNQEILEAFCDVAESIH